MTRYILAVTFAGALGVTTAILPLACQSVAPVIGPTAALAVCIATDAADGKAISAIATDCGTDVLAVIEALLGSEDPKVMTSAAYQEAKVTTNALKAMP